MRKRPFAGIELTSQRVSTRLPLSYRGDRLSQYSVAESWINAFLLASVVIAERKGKESARTRVKAKSHLYSTVHYITLQSCTIG